MLAVAMAAMAAPAPAAQVQHDFDPATLAQYLSLRFSSAVPPIVIQHALAAEGFSQRDLDLVAASPSGRVARSPAEAIKRVDARENLGEIFAERFSVSDKIEKILQLVGEGQAVRFSDLFAQAASRVEIVVTFLALLELIRLNQVRALQRKMFDEIEIAAIAA